MNINYKRLYEDLMVVIYYCRESALYNNKKSQYNLFNDIINYMDEQEVIEREYASVENENN